jgi:hypothetical protein
MTPVDDDRDPETEEPINLLVCSLGHLGHDVAEYRRDPLEPRPFGRSLNGFGHGSMLPALRTTIASLFSHRGRKHVATNVATGPNFPESGRTSPDIKVLLAGLM